MKRRSQHEQKKMSPKLRLEAEPKLRSKAGFPAWEVSEFSIEALI